MTRIAILLSLLSLPAFASIGSVSELEGGATRTPKGAAAPVALAEGAEVEVGDTLEVASGGNLALTLTDESVIVLAEGSKLSLDEARFGEQDSKVFSATLLLGSLWAKVTKLAAGSDSKFQIATERGIAGVRGTVFTVDLADGPDAALDVGVEEGEVEVAHAVPEDRPEALAQANLRPKTFDQPSGAGNVAPPRFPRRERIAAGQAVTFGKAMARHRYELRRARMAAFVHHHRERWLRRALEREKRRREPRREEQRERRRR